MFDRDALIKACHTNGSVARVVVADVAGSAPREVGAAMLVWDGGQSGTIGGGVLEYELANIALKGEDRMTQHALGPDMGQCCGGSVHILTEIYDLARAEALPKDVIARGEGAMPLQMQKLISDARSQGVRPKAQRIGSWLIEPVHAPENQLWIWGAGHVGRALVNVMAPLPNVQITWVDTALDRYPNEVPDGVTVFPAKQPADAIPYANVRSHHLILTYSHAIDLALCHGLLSHGFATCGLIGSATKWARFQKRLVALGHQDTKISDIMCPIGAPSLGKHPQLIAIGVADQLIRHSFKQNSQSTPIPQEATA